MERRKVEMKRRGPRMALEKVRRRELVIVREYGQTLD